jgi:hypothetical protein
MENKVIAKEYVDKNYIRITEMIKVIEEEREKDYVSENGYNALSSIIDYLKEKVEDK